MRRRKYRGMIRCFLALLALAPMLALSAETVALDCNSSAQNHCFGTVYWDGGTHGSTVEITVHPNTYVNNGNWFITNEMWLTEWNNGNEPASGWCYVGGPAYWPWMEVGMISVEGRLRYFWNECPPGREYDEHWGVDVPSGDFYQQTYFKINRSDTTSPNDYKIWIASPTLGTMTGYSQNNNMNPDRITIGMEVGTDAGYWSGLTFSKNRYIWGDDYDVYIYQHRDGDGKTISNPPSAGWITVPAPGNQGGSWYTSCGTC